MHSYLIQTKMSFFFFYKSREQEGRTGPVCKFISVVMKSRASPSRILIMGVFENGGLHMAHRSPENYLLSQGPDQQGKVHTLLHRCIKSLFGNTVVNCLMTGAHSENCVLKLFCHCLNVLDCMSICLGDLAYYTIGFLAQPVAPRLKYIPVPNSTVCICTVLHMLCMYRYNLQHIHSSVGSSNTKLNIQSIERNRQSKRHQKTFTSLYSY
jgi:hypothetical protein